MTVKSTHGSSYSRQDCRLCGKYTIELVLSLTPTPVGLAYLAEDQLNRNEDCYPLDLYLCLSCGYTGLKHVVDAQVVFGENTDITSMSLGLIEHHKEHVRQVSDYLNMPKGSLVVDIGSNDGTFLNYFKQDGMKVLGIEASPNTARLANESGINTLAEFFTRDLADVVKQEHGLADIVSANRVMANIDDMNDFIEGIKSLLAADGVFIFETGYLVDLIQNGLFETIQHEHLGYDSVKPLDSFFKAHQMELIDIKRNSVKGGSIRGVVQHVGGPRSIEASVETIKSWESQIGADTQEFFEPLIGSIDNTKSELADLMSGLSARNCLIAGYGAAIGSTTMIYHLELGETLAFLMDDDPRNQGLFSPGYHIPVFGSQVIYERNPDYILILAWRYADAIINKHQHYLDNGGHFIVPLPTIRII